MSYQWPSKKKHGETRRAARLFGPILLSWDQDKNTDNTPRAELCERMGILVTSFRKYILGQGLPDERNMERIINFYAQGNAEKKQRYYDRLVESGIISRVAEEDPSIKADTSNISISLQLSPEEPGDMALLEELRLAGIEVTKGGLITQSGKRELASFLRFARGVKELTSSCGD